MDKGQKGNEQRQLVFVMQEELQASSAVEVKPMNVLIIYSIGIKDRLLELRRRGRLYLRLNYGGCKPVYVDLGRLN